MATLRRVGLNSHASDFSSLVLRPPVVVEMVCGRLGLAEAVGRSNFRYAVRVVCKLSKRVLALHVLVDGWKTDGGAKLPSGRQNGCVATGSACIDAVMALAPRIEGPASLHNRGDRLQPCGGSTVRFMQRKWS